jgi:hypothetical protein
MEINVSSDRITTEQRRGIHDRGRKIGTNEGLRSGVNQLASYLGPRVGEVSLFALGIVIDATDDDTTPQKSHFETVNWEELGAETLGDLTVLTPEELAGTQPNPKQGEAFAAAVSKALAVFNLP